MITFSQHRRQFVGQASCAGVSSIPLLNTLLNLRLAVDCPNLPHLQREFMLLLDPGETSVGDRAAIIPSIEGRAWRTGSRKIFVDPDDPWPEGYRVSDTWPGA